MSPEDMKMLSELSQKVRDYLRDGVCHQHTGEIKELGDALANHGEWHNRLVTIDPMELYQILRGEIMHYAALDHLDKVPIRTSWLLLAKGKALFQSLKCEFSSADLSMMDSSGLKHKLAFVISYGNELYRRDNLDESMEVCHWVYKMVKKAHSTVNPMHGMVARACLQLAKPYRQKMEYEKAREYYAEALESTYRQAEIKAQQLVNQTERIEKEMSYYRRRSIMILAAGSGYINIASGNFNRAAMVLWPMRTALLHDQDTLSQTFIKMLTASINRARAGSERNMLEKACQDLEESYTVFNELEHVRYMRPTIYELVLGLIYLKQWEKAEYYTRRLRSLPRDEYRNTNNQRWEIIAGLLDGIRYKYQKNYSRALECVEKTMSGGNNRAGSQNLRSRIEVAILCGEALFHMDEPIKAEKKFREAEDLFNTVTLRQSRVLSDKHLLVVARVYRARIALKMDKVEEAHSFFDEVKNVHVEHQWVRDLLAMLERDLIASGSKLIISDFQRPYKEIERELQDWLVRRLMGIHGHNATRIAEVLQERRQNVGEWISRSRDSQPARKRRSKRRRKSKRGSDQKGSADRQA